MRKLYDPHWNCRHYTIDPTTGKVKVLYGGKTATEKAKEDRENRRKR